MAKRASVIGGVLPRGHNRAKSAHPAPQANGPDSRTALAVRTDAKGNIWSHIRQKWLEQTPEEQVRQDYVCTLVNEYGFSVEQMDEEVQPPAVRGHGNARADIVIWRTVQDRHDNRKVFIVVECKSDNVTIALDDYQQGCNYANYEQAPFFVTHNHRQTRYWRVDHQRRAPNYDEIENIPHADASDKEVAEVIAKLKTFKEDEFADLLHQCHNVIRNREHLDPAAAFDEIAKILFIKVDQERRLRGAQVRRNLFTAEFLDDQKRSFADPVKNLFEQTKEDYRDDRIFEDDEKINLKFNTVREIVRLLERYNLSDTSEDIKGIAFERFLGKTFRGDIGQYFTPRSIVEFMVRMLEPGEADVICDPASGSGGFLIRFFEIVREQILADVDREYQAHVEQLAAKNLSASTRAEKLRHKYEELQRTIDGRMEGSRLWSLANRCIYGCDANPRMARTSKMNMVMHGDGHGGVHHHNGFINVNGIFQGRFDIILTNPPFGANVEPSDRVTELQVRTRDAQYREYTALYGQAYRDAHARVKAAEQREAPIASLFELPKRGRNVASGAPAGRLGKVKTEILFIERCLELLKPGGRLGIVLPEGILNNPSLAYVREFCEDRAFIRAVVSLPQETFNSAGATVKASLLFMQRFTEQEKADHAAKRAAAELAIGAKSAPEIRRETARLRAEIDAAKTACDAQRRKKAQAELAAYERRMGERKEREARALLKERFDYPIFLYDAEHVGITATGEPDTNDLYPNPNLPAGMTDADTCLELYRRFRAKPKALLVDGGSR